MSMAKRAFLCLFWACLGADPDALSLLQQGSPRRLLGKRHREPLWRISLQGLSDGDFSQDEHLVMNHLAKCGGSYVKAALFLALPGQRLKVEEEEQSLSAADFGGRNFVIGLVRNPFDYYASLWSFTSQKGSCCFRAALTAQQQRETLGRETPFGSTEEDRRRFKDWLFAVNSKELGTESLRFYGSYLWNWGERRRAVPESWHYSSATAEAVRGKAAQVQEALRQFAAEPSSGPVRCWIRTEELTQGLLDCLLAFEREVGKPVVDWLALRQGLEQVDRNEARHVACELLYDNESLELVASADRELLKAFDYPRHCR